MMALTSSINMKSKSAVNALKEQAHSEKLGLSLPAGASYSEFLGEKVANMNDEQKAQWMILIQNDQTGGAQCVLFFCARVAKDNKAAHNAAKQAKATGSDLSDSSARINAARRAEMQSQLRVLIGM
jgi:hypothetical protein